MKHPSVLVVDDNLELAENISEILELEDIQGECASDGPTALSLMAERNYDLVITDIRMPGMNGVELLRQIRHRWPAQPVIVMSAFASEQAAHDAAINGALEVLSKPVNCGEVVAMIRRVVQPRAAVLLVDDDDALRVNLTELLLSVDFVPYHAPDIATAETLLRSTQFRAAVIDVHLPDGDGSTLGQHLRDEFGDELAIIYITGHSTENHPAIHGMIANNRFMRLLQKPFAPGQLVDLLNALSPAAE